MRFLSAGECELRDFAVVKSNFEVEAGRPEIYALPLLAACKNVPCAFEELLSR